mgnify:CR=1 FL=1
MDYTDFYQIKHRWVGSEKRGYYEIYPEFLVTRSQDLMVRGKAFYAVWDDTKGLWSTDEYDVQRIVDADLKAYYDEHPELKGAHINWMRGFSTGSWTSFKKYVASVSDNAHQLDERLTFSNMEVRKKDYISKRLPYPLEAGDFSAFDEIIGTLYEPEERAKLEWAIGAIVAGDARDIQKFVVLYGEAGAGKSTILNIVQKLFEGYYTTFEAKALTSSSNQFSTEVFKTNPLVGIQHDGDLSKIEDNTKLNSIVSHEEMTMNEKYKPSYMARTNCFLFMATNRPVKITDAKSGVIRRLIDVRPSGKKIPPKRYQTLMTQIDFQLGAIATHCMEVYRGMGKNYYNGYRPVNMILQTDVFYNFVESNYSVFREQNGISLTGAYEMYKRYCDEALVDFKLPRHKFREELKNYFEEFLDVTRIEGKQVRSYYQGFQSSKFTVHEEQPEEEHPYALVLDSDESLFDLEYGDCPAQYGNDQEKPFQKWSNVKTELKDLDTRKLHYVKVPKNLIVIDFDLKDENGEKSFAMNLEAASKWPVTYAELSKSGKAIHLHYIYDGDVGRLQNVYAKDIEIKVFNGNSSLRRKLTKCNDVPIAHINSGLPVKEEANVVNHESIKSERSLRDLITRNLKKEIHPGTKPSVDFIYVILEDAYKSGLKYDVTDMRPRILAFANNSTHNAQYCVKLVSQMKFQSAEQNESSVSYEDDALYFFDVEVFPNLFVVVYKKQGGNPVKMINPTQFQIEMLSRCKLIGFNCRRYDNHILYGRMLGYTNEQLYNMSQRIINGSRNAFISEAYNLSYTDVYDFSSKKQSLKKFEIELGIHHQELGLPWDEPVPEELWEKVADYCINDVIATEKVFEARHADFVAREILADVAGMSVNDTTNSLTQKIIFGSDKNPQSQFNYRNMGEPEPNRFYDPHPDLDCDWDYTVFQLGKPIFPGYKYEFGKSWYRDEDPKEGGYVYSEPGMYGNVALLDIASMHPSSIIAEELFGPVYTARFKEIMDARIAIKHKDFDTARKLMDGKLAKYLEDESVAKDLAQALKIAINSVYGLTSAKFDNRCRDNRNVDNIVAKRGALFMINLKHEVQARGYIVAHIKTDSIKIPDATPEIIQFVTDYGKLYGYNFEHEDTYDKLCLVNDAVYIARYKEPHIDKDTGKEIWWTATGAQFQVPYVFKKLFSGDDIQFKDMCETKTVSTSLYLDMNENLEQLTPAEEKELSELDDLWHNDQTERTHDELVAKYGYGSIEALGARYAELCEKYNASHDYQFVGKAGAFCPILSGKGGGELVREKDGKYYAATGTKGFRWLESEVVETLQKQADIDTSYYERLCDEAKASIENYGDFTWFTSDDPYTGRDDRHIWPF